MDTPSNPAAELCASVIDAIRENRLDEAESLLKQLGAIHPNVDDFRVYHVIIAIQRGNAREALRELEETPGNKHDALKALLLKYLGEPHWEGMARELAGSPDPSVRTAMQQLLGQPVEA